MVSSFITPVGIACNAPSKAWTPTPFVCVSTTIVLELKIKWQPLCQNNDARATGGGGIHVFDGALHAIPIYGRYEAAACRCSRIMFVFWGGAFVPDVRG